MSRVSTSRFRVTTERLLAPPPPPPLLLVVRLDSRRAASSWAADAGQAGEWGAPATAAAPLQLAPRSLHARASLAAAPLHRAAPLICWLVSPTSF